MRQTEGKPKSDNIQNKKVNNQLIKHKEIAQKPDVTIMAGILHLKFQSVFKVTETKKGDDQMTLPNIDIRHHYEGKS